MPKPNTASSSPRMQQTLRAAHTRITLPAGRLRTGPVPAPPVGAGVHAVLSGRGTASLRRGAGTVVPGWTFPFNVADPAGTVGALMHELTA